MTGIRIGFISESEDLNNKQVEAIFNLLNTIHFSEIHFPCSNKSLVIQEIAENIHGKNIEYVYHFPDLYSNKRNNENTNCIESSDLLIFIVNKSIEFVNHKEIERVKKIRGNIFKNIRYALNIKRELKIVFSEGVVANTIYGIKI